MGSVVHGVGHGDAHLLAEAEEMVHCLTGRENHSREIVDIYLLLTELACRQSLDLYERPEDEFHPVAFGNIEVW